MQSTKTCWNYSASFLIAWPFKNSCDQSLSHLSASRRAFIDQAFDVVVMDNGRGE
jgi:hypothetical protein